MWLKNLKNIPRERDREREREREERDTHIQTCINIYIYKYKVCMYMCMCVHIYIYVYVTNAHTHKHTHTLDPNIQNITNRLCVSSGAMRCQECPGCGVRTLRSMGCNHMTCTQCAMHWCWVCGRPWQPWHYGCTANSQGSADCSLM